MLRGGWGRRPNWSERSELPSVLFAGRLSREKGVDDLVEAARKTPGIRSQNRGRRALGGELAGARAWVALGAVPGTLESRRAAERASKSMVVRGAVHLHRKRAPHGPGELRERPWSARLRPRGVEGARGRDYGKPGRGRKPGGLACGTRGHGAARGSLEGAWQSGPAQAGAGLLLRAGANAHESLFEELSGGSA